MRVGGVGRVHGALAVDEGVGRQVGGDDEGGHADAQACEVVLDYVAVGCAVEVYAVAGRWDVCGWGNVVREATVFVKVEDY